MKAFALLVLGTLVGCAGREPTGPGSVTGRITSNHRFKPDEFSFMGRTYIDRSLLVDATGGVADAAAYLEGRPTTPWISGRVFMNFGSDQFEPRVAFVSPGQPIEIGDTRDDGKHEFAVGLKGLSVAESTVCTKASEPTNSGKPYRVNIECKDGKWAVSGKSLLARGRTKELFFDRPILAPLDWD